MVGEIHLSRSAWKAAQWLIISPHADDETLGAGALIYEVSRAGRLAGVVYLTDGSASHPLETAQDIRRLTDTRRKEARSALRYLTGQPTEPVHLNWPDAAPYAMNDPEFMHTTRQVAILCQTLRVDAIAVTARNEPHCDHVAAWQVACAAAALSLRPVKVFEYIVWATKPPERCMAYRTAAMPLGIRRSALKAHRSQLTPLFGDGFVVPAEMQSLSATDRLYLSREST